MQHIHLNNLHTTFPDYIMGGGEEFREFEEEILDDLEEEIDYDDDIWGEHEASDDAIEAH